MTMGDLDFWLARIKWIGIAAILLSIATWTMDLTGVVYECAYCRSQRTVIGLLGVILLLPRHWFTRFIATVFAMFGSVVAATQHFNGWKKIMAGKFEWGDQWYVNAWMLSGFASFIIVGLLLLLWADTPARRRLPEG